MCAPWQCGGTANNITDSLKNTYKTVLLGILSLISFTAEAQTLDGKASFYSNSLHGSMMANGKRYDRNAMTCAHKKLPFGTMLRVTNLNNGNSVVVEVTDRGPYVAGRIVDLSYKAASELGMLGAGVVRVKVDILPKGATVPYRTDEDNPLELPEGVEAGLAGVCYEFIPEWEKPAEARMKTVPRKTQAEQEAPAKKQDAPAKKQTATQKQSATQKQTTTQKQTATQKQPAPKQQKQQKPAAKKQAQRKEDGNSWSSFFSNLF